MRFLHLMTTGLLYFLTFSVVLYSVLSYSYLPLGELVNSEMKANFQTQSIGIYSHIFASTIALVLGPFQFSVKFRKKHLKIHRWLGRIYLVSVLIGGISGLYMAQYAFGGYVSQLGFSVLAILWLYSGFKAYLAIYRGNIVEHKKWMIKNFSLTFAAVTLRLYLTIFMISGVEFSVVYPIIAWLCWVPNLVLAELWHNRVINKLKKQDRKG